MRIGSLFSGIGGLELGLEWAGLGRTVWQVERDEYCRRVLARHWPDVARFEDVRAVGASTLAPVDLICGGFPCQDISSAGKGAGLTGSRSGLWFEFLRVAAEMRPEWIVVENVASGGTRWVDVIIEGLERIGYVAIPFPLSACDVGAPHERARIFIVAHADREQLRQQQGRGSGTSRDREAEFAHAGEAGTAGDTYGNGESAEPQHVEMAELRCVASYPSNWSAPPEFRGVDDGISNRLDRNRALGNAVVPQCAEVIGHIILRTIEAKNA